MFLCADWLSSPSQVTLRDHQVPSGHDVIVSLTPRSPLYLFSSPTIPSSGLIQSILWGDCSREKDVAEANKRIITTGSKQSCKSIPSGHGGFCMKQRKSKTRQTGQGTERGGRDKRKEKERRERKSWTLYLTERVIGSACCCLTDALLRFSSFFVCLSLLHVLITPSFCAYVQTALLRLIYNCQTVFIF